MKTFLEGKMKAINSFADKLSQKFILKKEFIKKMGGFVRLAKNKRVKTMINNKSDFYCKQFCIF